VPGTGARLFPDGPPEPDAGAPRASSPSPEKASRPRPRSPDTATDASTASASASPIIPEPAAIRKTIPCGSVTASNGSFCVRSAGTKRRKATT